MEEFVYTGNGQHVPEDVVSVRFDPSVTEADGRAFRGCIKLQKVVLNGGLKKIGNSAFIGCSSLESITLPSTVTEIDHHAFARCSDLREVVFNDGTKKIGHDAFGNCTSLQSITLPSTVISIGNGAFYLCENMREIVLNEELQKIGIMVFAHCNSLESITLPSTLVDIYTDAFCGCLGLREVGLHDGLHMIGDKFEGCPTLERFTFPRISARLGSIIQTGHYPRVETTIDAIRGDMIVRNGSELFVPGAVLRGGSNWNTIKASLDQITSWIRYYEIKEATTLFELALWKAKLDQADEATDINRDAYRIEVPGPVKDTILQYIG